MKVSSYEVTLPLTNLHWQLTGEYALFNGLYGAVDIVTPQEAELISQAKSTPSLLKGLPEYRLEVLSDRGHIVSSEAQEAEDLRIISRLNAFFTGLRVINLVIIPTYNCNLRCKYCLERHRLARGQEWLERTMSDSMLDAIFAQMKNYKERGYSVESCTLFGGEPLLAQNKPLIRKICEHCRELDMNINAATNGCELDQFMDIVEEYNIGFLQITIDGVGEVHDKMRPCADGSGSYSRIMDNVALALSHGVEVSMRVNISRSNLSQIPALIKEFKARGFTDISAFSYHLRTVIGESDNTVNDVEVMIELLRSGIDVEEAVRHELAYNNLAMKLTGWLDKRRWPQLNTTYCGAENGVFVVDLDGLIYSCLSLAGMADRAVGFVEDGKFFYNSEAVKWKTRTVDRMTPCKTCPLLMLCGGGCARSSYSGSSPEELMTGKCYKTKEIFGQLVPRLLAKVRSEGLASVLKPQEYDSDNGGSPDSDMTAKSKYTDDDSCMSLSMREFLGTLTPEERNTLMTKSSERAVFDILKAHNFTY